jgi:hypothetical protein
MADYRYSFSLRLRHPSREPQTATNVLGLTPSRIWRAGDARTTPQGDPLEGVYKDSYWTATVAEGRSQEIDLPTAIGNVVERLWPNRQFLIDFVDSGGIAEFFIGWFFDEGNFGDVFDWRLFERLAQMRINLSFDVYAG